MIVDHRTAICAHRGGSESAPLSSWEAYRTSVEAGVDYVEFDIRRTADDELVAYHDPDVVTLTGRRLVRHLTYAQLCGLTGCPVPKVTEVLELISGQARGHLDLKESGYERRLLLLAHDILGADNFVLSTLRWQSVRQIKQAFPGASVALSLGHDLQGTPWRGRAAVRLSELFPLRRIRQCGADWVSMHHRLASAGVLRRCAREGLQAMVWTINEDKLIDRFLHDPHVSVLVTDRPRHVARRRATLEGQRIPRSTRRSVPQPGHVERPSRVASDLEA